MIKRQRKFRLMLYGDSEVNKLFLVYNVLIDCKTRNNPWKLSDKANFWRC